MNAKLEILKIVKNLNKGEAVGYPSVDMRMVSKGFFGAELKILVDKCVEEDLLYWSGKLSLTITIKGIEYIEKYKK